MHAARRVGSGATTAAACNAGAAHWSALPFVTAWGTWLHCCLGPSAGLAQCRGVMPNADVTGSFRGKGFRSGRQLDGAVPVLRPPQHHAIGHRERLLAILAPHTACARAFTHAPLHMLHAGPAFDYARARPPRRCMWAACQRYQVLPVGFKHSASTMAATDFTIGDQVRLVSGLACARPVGQPRQPARQSQGRRARLRRLATAHTREHITYVAQRALVHRRDAFAPRGPPRVLLPCSARAVWANPRSISDRTRTLFSCMIRWARASAS